MRRRIRRIVREMLRPRNQVLPGAAWAAEALHRHWKLMMGTSIIALGLSTLVQQMSSGPGSSWNKPALAYAWALILTVGATEFFYRNRGHGGSVPALARN